MSKEYDFTAVYGEIKANDSPNKTDLLRIGIFCQNALHQYSLNLSMGSKYAVCIFQ